MIDARFKYMNGRTRGRGRCRRLTCEDEEHGGVIEEIAGREMESFCGPAILDRMVWPSRTGRIPSRHGSMSTPLSQKPGSAAVMAMETGPVTSKLTKS